MEPEYIVIGVYTIATIGVFVYQANRYSALEKSLKALNDMLDSINKYKDIFKPDDIIDRMNVKHKLERENLDETYKRQTEQALHDQKLGLSKEMTSKAADEFMRMNKELIDKLSELTVQPVKYIITHPEFKDNKDLRDKFIKDNFPKNSGYFVEMCDKLLLQLKQVASK